ncbi:MAG: hypothetical protein SFU56_14815 [Capsulimonadales bacterium]|nr:hypothetical protein [Capsulimonadales bacterium]
MIRQATLSEMRARDMQIQAMQAAREAEIRLRQAEQRQERQSGR